jgi:putative aldouronate transport system substrate-binding protein
VRRSSKFRSLVILRDIYPESTPITAPWGGAHLLAMMGAGYGIPAGWNGNAHYDIAQDSWMFAPATDQYRELHSFLHNCYESGLLDPEMFDQSTDIYDTKVMDGHAFIIVTWITSGFDNWNATLRENGISLGEWAPMPVPESTIGIRAVPGVDAYRKGLIVPARVAKESYFLDLLAFLDWAVYSEEGRTLTTWGIEGLTYEQTPDGKRFLPHVKTPKNPDGTMDISKEYGFDLMFNLVENEEHEDYKKPLDIVAFLDNSLQASETATLVPDLNIPISAMEVLGVVQAKIAPYVTEMSRKFITGESSINTDWDTYITELENRGYKTIEAIWNNSWSKQ